MSASTAGAMIKLVIMGVAGSGKSTLAEALARRLGCRMIEGDDLHPPANHAKMRAGIALSDQDRAPWLDRLGEAAAAHRGDVVMACSALKAAYRDRLRGLVPDLKFVFIDIDESLAGKRVARRQGHGFPASLVASQFATLEKPMAEPGVLPLQATQTLAAQIDRVIAWLKGSLAAMPSAAKERP